MKKILGVSLVALMAASAADAAIVSKTYVDVAGNGNYVTTTNTTGQNITALDTQVKANTDKLALPAGSSTVAEAISNAVTQGTTGVLTTDNYGTTLNSVYVPQTRTINGSALSADVTLTGANVAATGYAKAESASAIAATDSVNTALGKLEYKADANADAIDAINNASTGILKTAENYTDNAITTLDLGNTYETKGAAATAKGTIDAYTVNAKAISTNPVLTGADIAATGYEKASAASAIAASDTVNAALGKLEYKIDAVDYSGKQDASTAVTHTANTAVGSATQTVYVDTDGSVKAGTTLGALADNDTISNADVASDAAIDLSKIAMPSLSTLSTTGTVVLTAKAGENGAVVYEWESIQR